MIGLVACCKTKLDRPAPARELYTSPLFRMSLAYATRCCSTVYVASALYGLVALDQVIDPYNVTIADLLPATRRTWADGIARNLFNWHRGDIGELGLVVLAGEAYAKPIAGAYRALERDGSARIVEPLRRMQIGERLSFLKRALRTLDRREPARSVA